VDFYRYIGFYLIIRGNSSRKRSLPDLGGNSRECNFEKWEATQVTFLSKNHGRGNSGAPLFFNSGVNIL